jgi:hypothetical protein
MKSAEELLRELINACDSSLPYVEATIHPSSIFSIDDTKGWVQIHGGRSRSSHKFITDLQMVVNRIRKELISCDTMELDQRSPCGHPDCFTKDTPCPDCGRMTMLIL